MEPLFELHELDSRPVAVCLPASPELPGSGRPQRMVYLLAGPDPLLELKAVMAITAPAVAAGRCLPFTAVAVGSRNWNSDYTPWPADAVFHSEPPFEGLARETIDWVAKTVLPWAENRYAAPDRITGRSVVGYSLAGLAALYALFISEAFNGCGCCSGSMWYDGWLPFLKQRHPRPSSRIYLSLGRSEEKSRNPRLAAVGDATREAAALFSGDPAVQDSVLVWHNGGHFTELPERVAAAMLWLNAG